MGVACGAQQFLYFIKKRCIFVLFLVLGCPQGQKVGAFWSKTMQIVKNDKLIPQGGGAGDITIAPTCNKMMSEIPRGIFHLPPP